MVARKESQRAGDGLACRWCQLALCRLLVLACGAGSARDGGCWLAVGSVWAARLARACGWWCGAVCGYFCVDGRRKDYGHRHAGWPNPIERVKTASVSACRECVPRHSLAGRKRGVRCFFRAADERRKGGDCVDGGLDVGRLFSGGSRPEHAVACILMGQSRLAGWWACRPGRCCGAVAGACVGCVGEC